MEKNKKKAILCDDIEQRNKNIDEFCENFIKDHKELFDKLTNEFDEE